MTFRTPSARTIADQDLGLRRVPAVIPGIVFLGEVTAMKTLGAITDGRY